MFIQIKAVNSRAKTNHRHNVLVIVFSLFIVVSKQIVVLFVTSKYLNSTVVQVVQLIFNINRLA